jgi:hypothetical protein
MCRVVALVGVVKGYYSEMAIAAFIAASKSATVREGNF